jgi:type IV fimbrial biogenesis protein FimT
MGTAANARGFTLIEMLVTVGVFAILASIAVPSFRGFIAQQRLRTASFDLHTDLLFARSEALKRNRNVIVRRRQVAGWNTGWVVVLDGTAQELRSRNGVGSNVSVNSPVADITFNGTGRVSSPAGTVRIGLAASIGSSALNRCLVLDPIGMPRSYAEACS